MSFCLIVLANFQLFELPRALWGGGGAYHLLWPPNLAVGTWELDYFILLLGKGTDLWDFK